MKLLILNDAGLWGNVYYCSLKKRNNSRNRSVGIRCGMVCEAVGNYVDIERGYNMGFFEDWERESTYSTASGMDLPYVVLQVTLKEKFLGTGSANLEDLEEVINNQFSKGYRLHTVSTSNGGSKGLVGGDRIQATLVFEKMNLEEAYYQYKEQIKIKQATDFKTLASKVQTESTEPAMGDGQSACDTNEQSVGQESKIIKCTKVDEDTIKCCKCGALQSIYRLRLGCRECGEKFIE